MSDGIKGALYTRKTNSHHYDEGAITDRQCTVVATARNQDVRRRLVACWNALQGVPTELLEDAVNAGITDVTQGNLFSARIALQKQRDELLAKVQGLMGELSYAVDVAEHWLALGDDWLNRARAAIAKAKEAS